MNIKDFIQNIIKEEMQSLKEDEANMKPGGEWTQPGVSDRGLPPDESIRGTTAEIVATILDLFAEYEIGHDGAIEVVHELADELGLVPADEVEPESRPIGFRIDEMIKKKLSEGSYSLSTHWAHFATEHNISQPWEDEFLHDNWTAEERDFINDVLEQAYVHIHDKFYEELDESVIKKLREAKGLATARVAQHGLDTAPSAMDDAHRAVVDAGGYNSPGMMRLMRTIAQAARGMNLSPQETLELAQSMLDADMLKTAENDPTGSLEEAFEGESRQLSVDELKAEIINMWNDMHGKESFSLRHLANWDEQSLHALHDTTDREHRDWHNQERVEDDLDDINYEKEMRNASQHDAQTSLDRLDAIEAETEKMREPEEGEEFAKHGGMGRGPREAKAWSSYGNAKTLFEGWRKFTEE